MKIALIIPAAGSSRRHPPNKLLNRIGTKTVIEQTLETYLPFPFEIMLVIGHQAEQITESLPSRILEKIHLIQNNHYDGGLSESIKAGVRAARRNYDYLGFGLGDKPFIAKETILRLWQELETNRPAILIPTYKGHRGHPVFFSRNYRDELLSLAGDSGGRKLLLRHADDVTWFPVEDPGIVLDMDTYYQEKGNVREHDE